MVKNVIAIIDGAVGSCGKAKVVGEIATDKSITLGAAITNCAPNAGHTFVDENGNATIFRNIPVSAVNQNTELFIGPGSAIDMEIFIDEYNRVERYLNDRKIYIHEMVPLICDRHKQYEREHITSGSTFKGGGAALMEKIMRDSRLEFFHTFNNAIVCSNEEWHEKLNNHLENPQEYVLLEGSQGCELSLNHSSNFPNVTCKDISSAQLLYDSGISPERLLQTIMVIRPFPIRISNLTTDGKYIYSGSYGKGEELTWTQINLASMYGNYPFNCAKNFENNYLVERQNRLKKLISQCPEIYLKQVLGDNFRFRRLDSITILEALEIERLVYKAKGFTEYETRFIELPMFDRDYPPNTIIDQSEQTTVTKMERRVFDLDIEKLKLSCDINTPSSLYLNFFQHLNLEYKGNKGNFEDYYFDKHLREYLNWLEAKTNVEISILGTGPKNGERILKRNLYRPIDSK